MGRVDPVGEVMAGQGGCNASFTSISRPNLKGRDGWSGAHRAGRGLWYLLAL